jgi:hypothetical protein
MRQPLSDAEAITLLTQCRGWLTRIATAISTGTITLTGQVPAMGNIVPRISAWLLDVPENLVIARRPNAAG